MIEVKALDKKYGRVAALKEISFSVASGSIYGLIGSNGAGKSTLLRILSGILRQNRGTLQIDGESVYENPQIKSRCFTISDEQYYFGGSTAREMMQYYRMVYPHFDEERYRHLMDQFGLDERRRLHTFSKGMRRQAAVISAVSSGADYLFCDESFDGLDPFARQAIKSVFIEDVADRQMTALVTSHNLQELENFCDSIGLLHGGKLLFSSQLDEVKQALHKVQYVAEPSQQTGGLFAGLEVVKREARGRLETVVVRAGYDEVEARLKKADMVFYELLPLSLEEIFITETEANGYDPKQIGM